MPKTERTGYRKTREQLSKRRVPELGYYFIVTDTKETEQNYMYGLRDSIPSELQGKLVIKVIKTKTKNLVEEAMNQASLNPQYGEIWIIFDRDQIPNFDQIISEALSKGIHVGWTNPCIEEWFSAYFGTMPTYTGSVSCCEGFSKLFENRTQQKYVKSDPAIYEKLNRFGNETKAIQVARQKMLQNKLNGKDKPSEQVPGTTVHLLVDDIKTRIHNEEDES